MTAIVADGGVDGLASAAIAFRRFPKAVIRFAESWNLIEVLKEIGTGTVLILDLPLPKEPLPHRVHVWWIHHVGSEAPSTSWLLRGWQEATDYLVKLGMAAHRRIDDTRMIYDAHTLHDATSYDPYDNQFRARVVRALAKGLHVERIPEVQQRARAFEVRLSKGVEEALKRAETLDDAMLIIWEDVPRGYAGRIAGTLTSVVPDVFLIWRRDDRIVLTLRCKRRSAVDIVEKLQQIDSGFITGGGNVGAAAYHTHTPAYKLAALLRNTLS